MHIATGEAKLNTEKKGSITHTKTQTRTRKLHTRMVATEHRDMTGVRERVRDTGRGRARNRERERQKGRETQKVKKHGNRTDLTWKMPRTKHKGECKKTGREH